MELENHLLQCLWGDWHDNDIEVVELRLRNRQTENIHFLVDKLGVFAWGAGELGLDPASEEIVDYCWLLRDFLTEPIQEKVQKLLGIVLLEATEDGHVGIN